MGGLQANAKLSIMGDPHGHFDETLLLLQNAGFVNEQQKWIGNDRKLVCVGDYVDRGTKGIETIDLFMNLQNDAGTHTVSALLGNHDVLILAAYYFGHHQSGGPGGTFYDEWVMNGGQPEELERLSKERMEWLSGLPAMLLTDEILITHADSMLYLNYGKTVKEVNDTFRKLLHSKNPDVWDQLLEAFSDRLAFYKNPVHASKFLNIYGGKILVHGHTPLLYVDVENPSVPLHYANGKCINVDACAYKGNSLIMYQE
jgi:hypothetical protein